MRDWIKRLIEPDGLKSSISSTARCILIPLHHGKLELLFTYPYHGSYEPLRGYLAAVIHHHFPHPLLTPDDPIRSSTYPVRLSAQVTRKENYATKLAALALQIAASITKRREVLQRFMLLNDSATLAVEVPIYFTPDVHL
jgi:hypothetical protein